jgi:energy-coupling factor transporter ATP-binding protein EcfA2
MSETKSETNPPSFADVVGTKPVPTPAPDSLGFDESPIASDSQSVVRGGKVRKRAWAHSGGTYWGVPNSQNSIPAGVYVPDYNPDLGYILSAQPLAMDGLVSLPGSAIVKLADEFDCFWDREDEFKVRGFVHKRGFLFWGPPGSGKSAALNLLATRLVSDRNGVVVFATNPRDTTKALKMLREIEEDRPIVVIMEDLDTMAARYGEADLLALLDGQTQIDRICFIATTNYPERLDARICDRPSRFDTVKYVGMPEAAARRTYLMAKESRLAECPAELERWVSMSDGFSIAHLKEMIIAVFCLNQSVEFAVARLDEMHQRVISSEDDKGPGIGFHARTKR